MKSWFTVGLVLAGSAVVGANASGLAALQAAPSPSPRASPSPRPSPRPRLRLDVDRHVQQVLEKHEDLPRFETSVEVVATPPDVLMQRFLKPYDLECGPTEGGAP